MKTIHNAGNSTVNAFLGFNSRLSGVHSSSGGTQCEQRVTYVLLLLRNYMKTSRFSFKHGEFYKLV